MSDNTYSHLTVTGYRAGATLCGGYKAPDVQHHRAEGVDPHLLESPDLCPVCRAIFTTPNLGNNQRHALRALLKHGSWPGGWVLRDNSNTKNVLNRLVERGLVVKVDGTYRLATKTGGTTE